jgi:hypothetical protein
MKKLIATSIVAVIGLAGLWGCDGAINHQAGGRLDRRSASTKPAPTVNPPAITLGEFGGIEYGMTLDQVSATFGSPGTVHRSTGSDRSESRWWDGPPGSDGFAMITFRDGIVFGKTQVGLS